MRIGTWITVPHPTIVDLIARQQFDWICIDLEHSPVSALEMQNAILIIQSHKKKAFVRVAQNSHTNIKFPLDAGADGIIIPMVNSFAEAKEAVRSCFYPPIGNRGAGLARAQKYGFGFEEHLKHNYEHLEVFVQIEHISAVKDLEEILKIEKLSGIFVGPYDLSGSMNLAGKFDSPEVTEVLQQISIKTKNSGKLLGAHVIKPEPADLHKHQMLGYNFIAFSIDTYFLGQKIIEALQEINERSN